MDSRGVQIMPGIGTLGTIIAGALLGGGMLFWVIRRLNQAEQDRLKRAGTEAYIKADLQASKQEADVEASSEKAQHAKVVDPTDWR